ncbi:MAG: peptidoglycan editing factor PgeF [Acidobacteriota bacterium]
MPELQLPDAFAWVPFPWGQALRCQPLETVARHGFTTRQPAIASGDGIHGDHWNCLAQAFGVPQSHVVRFRQVHGTRVVVVTAAAAGACIGGESSGDWGEADAAATDHSELALAVKVADCVPVLMADARTGAVAAVHAGWRGAMSGVAAAAVATLSSSFGADPADLVAAVGPSIGPCCYRVGAELRDQFVRAGASEAAAQRWFSATPPRVSLRGVPGSVPTSPDGRDPLWLNMWAVVSDQLRLAGLSADHVHVAQLCTSCHRDVFHSFRADGDRSGRMVAMIRAGGRGYVPSRSSSE